MIATAADALEPGACASCPRDCANCTTRSSLSPKTQPRCGLQPPRARCRLTKRLIPSPGPCLTPSSKTGRHIITQQQYDTLELTDASTFVRSDEIYFAAGISTANLGEGVTEYRVDIELLPDVTFPDGQDALLEALLDNVGEYRASYAQWLGVPLESDQYPLFKGKKLLRVPGSAPADTGYYALITLEHFDLTGDGTL